MAEKELKLSYHTYALGELPIADAELLQLAKAALENAYAPYSGFKVGAAVLLENGHHLTGTNQENAAFPVGLCAEGTALSAASSLFPQTAVKKIAVSVKSSTHTVQHPVAPCGVCRQRLLEYETRFNNAIEIILMGETGEVLVIKSVKDILPFYFSKSEL